MTKNQAARITLALMPRQGNCPQAALYESISPEARARAGTFLSLKRRADFLWARVLLGKLLHGYPGAVMQENPPSSPTIIGAGFLTSSVSHTSTWVGAGIGEVPFAFDLEVINPARVSQEIFTRLFGEALWEASEDRVLDFYRYFGLYESAVKMQAKFRAEADGAYVGESQEAKCAAHSFSDGKTLLTVVSTQPADIGITIFEDADATALFRRMKVPFTEL